MRSPASDKKYWTSWYSFLTARQRLLIVALAAAFVSLGVIVEVRSAFLNRRMTDFAVYLRAAWAVRSGADIYTITDENGWHYHYPALLAIILTPFADPPPGADRSGALPFGFSVAVWYIVNVGLLFWGLHRLATLLEQGIASPSIKHPLAHTLLTQNRLSPVPGTVTVSGRNNVGFALRLLPLVICLPPIGHTLMRGQVSLILFFLVVGMIDAAIRGNSWQSGFWLSGAVCLKVIPAFLLVYPLWRRDWRSLGGCVLGCALGGLVIPMLFFGPERTLDYLREWDQLVGRPGLSQAGDQSRAEELTDVPATDSQSFLAIIHNSQSLGGQVRPRQAAASVRVIHWTLCGVLTSLTLLAAGRRRRPAMEEAIFLGCLILIMILASPVCHLHYFALALPLAMALVAQPRCPEAASKAHVGSWLLFGIFLVTNAIPQIPAFHLTRDIGLAMWGALVFWAAGVASLCFKSERPAIEHQPNFSTAA